MNPKIKNLFIGGAVVLAVAVLAAWLLKAIGVIPLAIACILIFYFGWPRNK
jgi:hypothetical protein